MDTHTVNISYPNLPAGFRFHPTDQELIVHYLKSKVSSSPNPSVSIITDVDIYKFNPWELPGMTWFGDKEWFFFSPRDRKYPKGVRPNRAAGSGYWKATGTDKPIISSIGAHCLGVKKALVFYQGRPPKGVKTNWVMLEYRLIDNTFRSQRLSGSMRLDDWVLCRIRQKIKTPHHMKEHYDANCSSSPFTLGYLEGQEIVNKNADNCSSSPFSFGYLQGEEIVNMKAATEASLDNQFQDYLTTPLEMEEANEQGQEGSQISSPDYSVSDFDSNHPTVTFTTREVLESIKRVLSIGALDGLVPLPTNASTFYEENGSISQDSSPTTSTSNPLCFAEFTI